MKEYIINYDDIEITAMVCGVIMEFVYVYKHGRSLLLDIAECILNVIRNILKWLSDYLVNGVVFIQHFTLWNTVRPHIFPTTITINPPTILPPCYNNNSQVSPESFPSIFQLASKLLRGFFHSRTPDCLVAPVAVWIQVVYLGVNTWSLALQGFLKDTRRTSHISCFT